MNRISKIADENTRGFASACYDSNTVLQLLDAPDAEVEPDATDMEINGLTGEQWREACAVALLERVEDSGVALIDDGEELQLVRIDDLVRHLDTVGWVVDRPWVYEPEHDQTDPYVDLCEQVPAVAATREGDNRAGLVLLREDADIPTMTWRVDQKLWALHDPDGLRDTLEEAPAVPALVAEPAIRPCPFCGSEDVRSEAAAPSVMCHGCSALGPRAVDRAAAIAAWNRALRTADTITCAECGEQVQVGGCACGGQGMNAPNSRNTQKPGPVRRPRTQLVHEVCRNRLAIYEVFRADQKAEDEEKRIREPHHG